MSAKSGLCQIPVDEEQAVILEKVAPKLLTSTTQRARWALEEFLKGCENGSPATGHGKPRRKAVSSVR